MEETYKDLLECYEDRRDTLIKGLILSTLCSSCAVIGLDANDPVD